MTEALQRLLSDLEEFGVKNDQTVSDRPRRMLNITRDTGEFLSVLVRATNAKRVLEIGTSNGYSTLWLADATLETMYQVFKSGKGISLSGFGGFYLDRRRESTAFKFNPGQKLRALFGWSSKYKGKL